MNGPSPVVPEPTIDTDAIRKRRENALKEQGSSGYTILATLRSWEDIEPLLAEVDRLRGELAEVQHAYETYRHITRSVSVQDIRDKHHAEAERDRLAATIRAFPAALRWLEDEHCYEYPELIQRWLDLDHCPMSGEYDEVVAAALTGPSVEPEPDGEQ